LSRSGQHPWRLAITYIKHEPMVRHEALCGGHLALSGDSYVL